MDSDVDGRGSYRDQASGTIRVKERLTFYLMASELFAPLAESVILRLALPDVSMLRTMSIVFIANMVSWNAGIYLVYFWQGL
jgi:hypothetical protein